MTEAPESPLQAANRPQAWTVRTRTNQKSLIRYIFVPRDSNREAGEPARLRLFAPCPCEIYTLSKPVQRGCLTTSVTLIPKLRIVKTPMPNVGSRSLSAVSK